MTKRREFIKLVGSGTAGGLLLRTLPMGVGGLLLSPLPALAAVRLDTNDPLASFNKEGNQGFTPGPTVLALDDASGADFINFFAEDPDAAPGIETDVFTSFQVQSTVPNNADHGVRFVINDGQERAVIAVCIVKNGVRGIGLASSNQFADPNSYPDKAFVPVNWLNTTTLRVRRTVQGDGEIVEVNGAAPTPRKLLLKGELAPITRSPASVEFGCRSVEAQASVNINQFFSERVGTVAGALTISRIHIRDASVGDVLRLRADFELGAGSDGIDASTQDVSIRLSTSGGVFYPPLGNDFNPITGFQETGTAPRRRWTISDAERARTGIQAFVIDEDPDNRGKLWLVDRAANLPAIDYSNVQVELQIGNDLLVGTVNLAQTNSGGWRGG